MARPTRLGRISSSSVSSGRLAKPLESACTLSRSEAASISDGRMLAGTTNRRIISIVGTDASGQPIDVFRLVGPAPRFFILSDLDDLFSRYRGVSIGVNKRMSRGWQFDFVADVVEVDRTIDLEHPGTERAPEFGPHLQFLRPEPQ